ncbi:MAG: dihydrofolate reductase [Myxococcales bacterium]
MSQVAREIPFSIVVAADENRGIGRANGLPWKLPSEMAYFKRLTSEASAGRQNAVVMGRKTYESIPGKFRPLKDRLNVVLSRDPAFAADPGVRVCSSLSETLEQLISLPSVDRIFVIGGASLYAESLRDPSCRRVYLTRVHRAFECDAFLAEFEQDFRLVTRDGPHRDGDVEFSFEVYERTQRGPT